MTSPSLGTGHNYFAVFMIDVSFWDITCSLSWLHILHFTQKNCNFLPCSKTQTLKISDLFQSILEIWKHVIAEVIVYGFCNLTAFTNIKNYDFYFKINVADFPVFSLITVLKIAKTFLLWNIWVTGNTYSITKVVKTLHPRNALTFTSGGGESF